MKQTPLQLIATTSWLSYRLSRWSCPGWRPAPCLFERTSEQRTGSGNGFHIISPHSQPLFPPRHMITWFSRDSWLMLRRGFKTKKLPTQSYGRSSGWTKIPRDGTASLQWPNVSSWQWSHWKASTYCQPCHCQYIFLQWIQCNCDTRGLCPDLRRS